MAEPLLLIEQRPAEPLAPDVLRELIETTAGNDSEPKLDRLAIAAYSYTPAWYGDVELIEITAKNWVPQSSRLFYLRHERTFLRLDGTSPPIHKANAVADLAITAATALPYLAFFCFFVRGTEGPFLIVDRLDNRYLPPNANAAEFRKAFRPTTLWGQDENGDWRASSLVYYGAHLFWADFVISLNGRIDMKMDHPLVDGDGQQVNAPLNFEAIQDG